MVLTLYFWETVPFLIFAWYFLQSQTSTKHGSSKWNGRRKKLVGTNFLICKLLNIRKKYINERIPEGQASCPLLLRACSLQCCLGCLKKIIKSKQNDQWQSNLQYVIHRYTWHTYCLGMSIWTLQYIVIFPHSTAPMA